MDIQTTVTLLGVYKVLTPLDTFFLNLFFPGVVTSATKEIAFDKLVEDMELAAFVSPMVAGKVQKKDGGLHKTFEPADVKPKDSVEPGMLLTRRPGEAIGGNLTPAQRRGAAIVELMQRQDNRITRREEWMAVQAVLTGKITATMEGKGDFEIDYGRDSANNITLSGGALWTALNKDTSAQPLEDLETWSELASGSIDICVMDKKAWGEFRQFKAVKDLLDTRRGSTSVAELGPNTKKEASWVARLGTLEIYVYKGKYKEAGVAKNMIPDYTVILGSTGYEGIRAYGGIQDAKANTEGVVAATRYPKNWFTDDPSVEFLMTQAAPLMVTPDADAFVVATVGE